MEVEFPVTVSGYPNLQCFIATGSGNFRAIYANSTSGSYYYATYQLTEGKFYRTSQMSYQGGTGLIPYCSSNYEQLYPENPIVYKPELQVYFQFFSVILCSLIGVLLWKTLGRLIGR